MSVDTRVGVGDSTNDDDKTSYLLGLVCVCVCVCVFPSHVRTYLLFQGIENGQRVN